MLAESVHVQIYGTFKNGRAYAGRTGFHVPSGFVSDGASTPRCLWWLFPKFGDYITAAIVHDYCYRYGLYSRRVADGIFREVAERTSSSLKARLMYWAVRAFGWVAWRKECDSTRW